MLIKMRKKLNRLRDSEKGFILLTSYMLISVLSVSSLALFSRAGSFRIANERNINKTVAFNMAESGLDQAISQIKIAPNYTGTNSYVSMDSSNVQGGYSVTVTTPANNPNVRQITAVGYAPSNNNTGRAYETRTVTTYIQINTGSLFNLALFAKDAIEMSGNASIDSYDSRNGAYGGSNRQTNGDIGTDSTNPHSVTLSGNVNINGDVEVGPGGDPNAVIAMSGNSVINGTTSPASSLKNYGVQTSSISSLGALKLSGNTTLQIGNGTYRYDSISISGNAQLQALGNVVIYVDGTVSISGNGVSTQNNLPPNFIIYQTTGATVQISGNGNFYGGIYAPASVVKNTGNGAVYGALVSRIYSQNGNGAVHYDEAMNEVGGTTGEGVTVLSWRELNTTAWKD